MATRGTLSPRQFSLLKAALFLLCLVPAAAMLTAVFFSSQPPSDPAEFLARETGENALRLLIITLAMTPLRLIFNRPGPIKLRRMFGLFAGFYTLCHFLVYLFIDLQLDFALLWEDIVDRKYIAVGFAAALLMLPLALTSNDFSIKKMGFKAWQKLHRAIYPIALLGGIHYLWIQRGEDLTGPLVHIAVICALLALRLPVAQRLFRRA